MTTGYLLLGRPDWTRPRLAPDGDRLAAVRWHDGAANVWIGASKAPMQLATDLKPWHLRDFHWGLDGNGLILVLDSAGNEHRELTWLDLRTGAMTQLTPERAIDAQYAGQVGGEKPAVLVAVRHPFTGSFELQSVTPTGTVIATWQGPGQPVSRWLASETQAVAVCESATGYRWWHTPLPAQAWSNIAEIPAADASTSRPLAFSSYDRALFAMNSAGRDTVALTQMFAPSWTPAVISARERFDVTSVLMSPDGSRPDLVTTTDPDAPQCALTDEAADDLGRLRQIANSAPAKIIGRNASHCLAEISFPVGGPAYVTYSRASAAVSKPLARYTGLGRVRVQRREPFTYRARDGWLVTGFLTYPSGAPPWPAVLVVHGGPWSRDEARMDPWAQLLASAGLCCVQVNYRGSRGFGKEFRNAGNRQWSLAMQDDLVDALRSAQVADVIDAAKVGAIGHGYGGYAALMLATQSEVPLTSVVSASAPTDLVRHAATAASAGGAPGYEYAARIGSPAGERDRLAAASPVNSVARFNVPVLLFHGRQDARVPVSHATGFADLMRRAGKRYELVIYEDEGHRYSRPQNVADFQARSADFLRTTLGSAGRRRPD
jgi:dipeptidyl aminopeptidase/acylaminoacyl peptidase